MAKHKNHKEAIPSSPPSIRIEKADNGFIVSRYSDAGMKQMVFKDAKEAVEGMKKMMGGMMKNNQKV